MSGSGTIVHDGQVACDCSDCGPGAAPLTLTLFETHCHSQLKKPAEYIYLVGELSHPCVCPIRQAWLWGDSSGIRQAVFPSYIVSPMCHTSPPTLPHPREVLLLLHRPTYESCMPAGVVPPLSDVPPALPYP